MESAGARVRRYSATLPVVSPAPRSPDLLLPVVPPVYMVVVVMRFLQPAEQSRGILEYCFDLQHKLTDCRAEVERLQAPQRRWNRLVFLGGFAAGAGAMGILLMVFVR